VKTKRGRILQGDGPILGSRVFYVLNGVRYYISSSEWLTDYDFVWPDDVQKIDESELLALSPGRPAARRLKLDWTAQWSVTEHQSLREIASSLMHGYGVEFGAGSNPLPMPVECDVAYADPFTYDQLLRNLYPGQTAEMLVRPSIQEKFDEFKSLSQDVDFIAAAHVIEHVRDPIGAIVRASSKIREQGNLLLFVADMAQTFDRYRELTSLDHLMLDFYSPDAERDREHYKEFYRLAFVTPPESYDNVWKQAHRANFPIHYHTWTYESFKRMIDWIINSLKVYKTYISHPTVGNEFCFILKK
jgi:hypothetical protein